MDSQWKLEEWIFSEFSAIPLRFWLPPKTQTIQPEARTTLSVSIAIPSNSRNMSGLCCRLYRQNRNRLPILAPGMPQNVTWIAWSVAMVHVVLQVFQLIYRWLNIWFIVTWSLFSTEWVRKEPISGFFWIWKTQRLVFTIFCSGKPNDCTRCNFFTLLHFGASRHAK